MATIIPSFAIRPCYCVCGATESSKLAVTGNKDFGRLVLDQRLFNQRLHFWKQSPHWSLDSRVCSAARVPVQQTELRFSTSAPLDELNKVSTYLFRTQFGGHVKVLVRKKNAKYAVYIEVSSLELGTTDYRLMLIWGIYRSDSSCFMPLDSQNFAPNARKMDTALVQNSFGTFALELEFEPKQTPFYLSFLLKSKLNTDASGLEIKNHKNANFCVPIGFNSGDPSPLGLSFSTDGSMNFAFFSRNVEGLVLCLYDDSTTDKPALELDLDPYVNRTGDVWHASLEGAWTFTSYGYRCKGAILQGNTSKVDMECVLLDPYARVIASSMTDHGSRLSAKYLGRLCEEPAFEWGSDIRPNLAMEKLIVYRLNVKRFTEHKSGKLYSDIAGTFAGLIEKMDHFRNLGVNAVLLEPIFPFDEQKGPYFPYHFFSPSNIYGPSGGSISAITSMKEMVKELHANRIEVLLEVVFTHTAEGGALQGIDDFSYYYTKSSMDSRNALNCNYPIVQRMILDSLQHWVTEFHIDGFCFINASALLTGFHGEHLSRPPLVEAIAFDPILSKTKIIADPWHPEHRIPKETCFPHWKRWAEINPKFCIDVRNFLRGESLLGDLATRLCGSGDIFSNGRGPAFSFNYIARNSGLPLVDLVSFSGGELGSELSWNCGEEGPTNKTAVLERRLKQIRNYLFILYVSLGVPVLNMGDECGQSSRGSISYGDRKPFDWNALSTSFGNQMTQFISFLSSLRMRRSDLLQKRNFLKEENIDWHGNDQSPPRWEDPTCKFLAMTLKIDKAESQLSSEPSNIKGDLFMAFNAAGHAESVILPPVPEGMIWRRLVDTALPFPGFFSEDGEPVVEQIAGLIAYKMNSHSCTLFEAGIMDG
ncbi:isoamylase 2, chloroplastic [Ricinus communis]|uniref:Isoamylase, putative n=1 Tax=Ricinus communis TaxID=3988 RepID=B9T4B0_RICCO|nr:isoamylase 2, chloroplastic [Ricinus communis]XP_015583236.1 isoamylase 2, chloroplastic [Ricinus communis]EEF29318.1 isoamylase, putative [Ricinus communis]|eukprot:XP_002533079.1 isoamylase 2, chloroplastic [Ricinus communis]